MARPPGRPRGEFRRLLAQALAEHGPALSRELAYRTQIRMECVVLTIKDMVRAGEVESIARERVHGVKRPVNRWRLVSGTRVKPTAKRRAGLDLQLLLQNWKPPGWRDRIN